MVTVRASWTGKTSSYRGMLPVRKHTPCITVSIHMGRRRLVFKGISKTRTSDLQLWDPQPSAGQAMFWTIDMLARHCRKSRMPTPKHELGLIRYASVNTWVWCAGRIFIYTMPRRPRCLLRSVHDYTKNKNHAAGHEVVLFTINVALISCTHSQQRALNQFQEQTQKTQNSNLHGFEIHRPSSKATKLRLQVIKAIINQSWHHARGPSRPSIRTDVLCDFLDLHAYIRGFLAMLWFCIAFEISCRSRCGVLILEKSESM